jgi:hypothetical protein
VRFSVTAVSVLLVLSTSAGEPPPDSDWGIGDLVTGNDGTSIVIDGTRTTDGTQDSQPVPGEWEGPADPVIPQGPSDFERCLDDWDANRNCFSPIETTEEEEAAEDTPGLPAVTIADLVRFAPPGSSLTGEPNNVGVAGLPTNFVTTAQAQTVTGELLGFPLSVRFTPAAYDFVYGDGTISTSSTGGSPWADLAQAQFTPTDTSHAYKERGTYTAQVNVRYSAEVDFGTGWFPVTGQVTADGTPQPIRIFEAHTALVAFTCAEAPRSPGC